MRPLPSGPFCGGQPCALQDLTCALQDLTCSCLQGPFVFTDIRSGCGCLCRGFSLVLHRGMPPAPNKATSKTHSPSLPG